MRFPLFKLFLVACALVALVPDANAEPSSSASSHESATALGGAHTDDASRQKEACEALYKGVEFLSEKQYQKAITYLDKSAELNGKDANVYWFRSVAFARIDEPDKAIADAVKAIEMDSKNPLYFLHRATIHAARGNDNAMKQDVEAAKLLGLRLEDGVLKLHTSVEETVANERLKSARKSVQMEVLKAGVHNNKVAALLKQGAIGKAPRQEVVIFQTKGASATEIKAGTLNNEGAAALKKGDYASAVKFLRQSLSVSPGFSMAKDNLAMALNQYGMELDSAGRMKEALSAYEEALKLKPSDMFLQSNISALKAEMKRKGVK